MRVCMECVHKVCLECVRTVCVVKSMSSFPVIFVFEVCVWSVCIECIGRVCLAEFERRYVFRESSVSV